MGKKSLKMIRNDFLTSSNYTLNQDGTFFNYLALMKCIIGVKTSKGIKYPTIEQSCRAYRLFDTKTFKIKTFK
jgi:hypothetical protein